MCAKLFNDFRLSDRVPETNFYRRLKSAIDLRFFTRLPRDFMGKATKGVMLHRYYPDHTTFGQQRKGKEQDKQGR
jgi:hypothetical protein